MQALARAGHDEASAEIAGYQHGLGVFARPGLVSLALVQGHAVGAGFQLSLACDVRIAAEDAQFSMAEVSLGLVPDLGGTKRLVELVGYSRAAEICLTGRRVDATEALRIGLVSSVVAAGELAEAGERFVIPDPGTAGHRGHRDQGAAAGGRRPVPGRAGASRT